MPLLPREFRAYVPAALRRQIQRDAGTRCGYCLTSATLTGMPLVIDHIVPRAAGGLTVRDNLWLACYRCNEFKGAKTDAYDLASQTRVPLFNPRTQRWAEHFAWSDGGTHMAGLTPTGRATVAALRVNNKEIVEARRQWVAAGWHPPLSRSGG